MGKNVKCVGGREVAVSLCLCELEGTDLVSLCGLGEASLMLPLVLRTGKRRSRESTGLGLACWLLSWLKGSEVHSLSGNAVPWLGFER